MSTANPVLPEAVSAALAAIDLSDATSFAAIEASLEPLAEAVFVEAAAGRPVDVDRLMDTLIDAHDLDADQAFRARSTLERNVEAGDAKFTIFAGMLQKSRRAVIAAAGVLQWEIWRAEHPNDIVPAANGIAIRKVAKHIARRARDVLGESLAPAEAAWAAVEGACRAHLPIDRAAWTDALEGAESGERERLAEIARLIA